MSKQRSLLLQQDVEVRGSQPKGVADLDQGAVDLIPRSTMSSAPTNLNEYIWFVDQLKAKGLIKRPIYPSMLMDLGHLRDQAKKEMKTFDRESVEFMAQNILQASIKLIMVSSYGVAGMHATEKSPHLKSVSFFDQEFFNDVTCTCQDIIKLSMKMTEKNWLENLYGDTDSIFFRPKFNIPLIYLTFQAENIAHVLNEDVKRVLLREFRVDPAEYWIQLDAKNVYEAIIFTSAKKKYRGDGVWSEGVYRRFVDLMGFESKRSDAFVLLAETQDALQEILINAPMDWTIIVGRILAYMRKIEVALFGGELDAKLVQEKTVKKTSLEDYGWMDGTTKKGVPPHARAAKQLQDKGALRMGDRVGYVVVGFHKGKQKVEAIDPRTPAVIPHISIHGYRYHMGRLKDMMGRLIGRKYEDIIDAKLARWTEEGEVDG